MYKTNVYGNVGEIVFEKENGELVRVLQNLKVGQVGVITHCLNEAYLKGYKDCAEFHKQLERGSFE